jgi:hypothetical protein
MQMSSSTHPYLAVRRVSTMASNFLKLARALAAAGLVSGASAALADTSVTNTAGATIRVNPYSVTATYDKSQSAAVQANGIGGFNLQSGVAGSYVNPLDAMGATGTASGTTAATTSLLGLSGTTCSNATYCKNASSSLLSVSGSNPVLADIYAVTDSTGTFSLDISSKNADRFTANNKITSPTGTDIGVSVGGASSYQVSQQGVAGITAEVLSPTKVTLNTDAAGGGSTGQISMTAKSMSNGVQETYNTSGSVSVDGASAYLKANTTNHIALNAVNATIDGKQTITNGNNSATFTNTDIVATTFRRDYTNSDSESITDQTAVLASGNYVTKDALKGATSIKITADPADALRKLVPASSTTRTATTTELSPKVDPLTGSITLPDFSTQTLTASGVSWVGGNGTSSSQARDLASLTTKGATGTANAGKTTATVNRGGVAVSNVNISSAAGGGGVNTMTSGGFGNTVNMQTTFDMTVFGR